MIFFSNYSVIDYGLSLLTDTLQKVDLLKWLFEYEKTWDTQIALIALEKAMAILTATTEDDFVDLKTQLTSEIIILRNTKTLKSLEDRIKSKLHVDLFSNTLLSNPTGYTFFFFAC